MVQTAPKQISLEEFLQLEENKPAREYIDGQIVPKPIPQGKHSKIQWELLTTINAAVKPERKAHAFPELRCSFGGRSIVPDVVVFVWARIPLDENGEVANTIATHPDWIIEILSPKQSPTKVIGNILHCLEYGCSLGWLIDPDERSVLIFPPGQQPRIFRSAQDSLPAPDFLGDFAITVGQIWDFIKL